MSETRAQVKLLLHREELAELLHFDADSKIVQITAESDGNLTLLIENPRFPLVGRKTHPITIDFGSCLKAGNGQPNYFFGPLRLE